ncbi:MAG: hypothetical protein A3I26_03520 [Candidatus Yanofskybacteria bacterium RIFCSPLOWO2_02_FULL_43_10]|nr:MAG: hypothetical protein A3I26_03520 [Candidatus Yanofskybacteria bacterium RIFCSPLOWO2_02_FULL_43_10]
MTGLIFQGILIAALAGLAIKFFLDYQRNNLEITWGEYGLGLLAISFVLTPLIVWAGWSVVRSSNLSFNEYRNGWELQAVAEPVQCARDGPCWHEYDCDPYIVMVSYQCNCTTDKDGRSSCSTCWRPETRYHDCPYVTVETSYSVQTTLGSYTIAEHRFPENPQSHRWRTSKNIPQYVIDRVGVSEPQFWQAADVRVRAGKPGPVTARASYDNYILASDSTILNQYSGEVEKLLAVKMLPELSHGLYDYYMARKAYSVGPTLRVDTGAWSEKVAYLNAALGSELQGDLHVVLIHDADLRKVGSSPDEYALTLKAYWQNTKHFQKDALSKNTIVVVVGTKDGESVSWVRAMIGMPLGNERMITEIRNSLVGVPFLPEAVIGGIRGHFEIYGQKVKSSQEVNGRLGSIIWGRELKETRFRRVSMSSKDPDDFGQGFRYLANEIQLTWFQHGMILFLSLLGCGVVWYAAAAHGIRDPRNHSGPFDVNRIKKWWKSQWREMRAWIRVQKTSIADKVGGRRTE